MGGIKMHAVVVNVTISDPEGSEVMLRDQVVPRVAQAPGFVAGYWTRKGNGGLSMSVWESEDAANTASEMVRSAVPEGVTVDSVEVREVVASA
jgi:heme-degrading monooxygenase HmoA